MVGVRGFEPPTPSSRTRCATRLRYTPICRRPPWATQRASYSSPAADRQEVRQRLLMAPTRACGGSACELWSRAPAGRAAAIRAARFAVRSTIACIAPRAQLRPNGRCAGRYGGASPSGKAADFDSAIRRFESSRPSHTFRKWLDFAMSPAEAGVGTRLIGVSGDCVAMTATPFRFSVNLTARGSGR